MNRCISVIDAYVNGWKNISQLSGYRRSNSVSTWKSSFCIFWSARCSGNGKLRSSCVLQRKIYIALQMGHWKVKRRFLSQKSWMKIAYVRGWTISQVSWYSPSFCRKRFTVVLMFLSTYYKFENGMNGKVSASCVPLQGICIALQRGRSQIQFELTFEKSAVFQMVGFSDREQGCWMPVYPSCLRQGLNMQASNGRS